VAQAWAIKQALEKPGFAEVGVVRMNIQSAIVRPECNKPTVVEDIDHPEIDQDLVVIEFAPSGWADIARIRARMGAGFVLLVNYRCAGTKF